MPWDTGLNGVHLAIAAYPGTPLRVVAGPGTGKTFALMRRVARLLEAGVQPEQVLAVTFTRTAANDLVEKLATLGVEGAENVAAKTLHSLSFGILSTAAVLHALGRVSRPLLDCELDTLVCDLQDQFGGKREVKRLIKAFEAYWARLQHHQPGFPTDPNEQAFNRALRHWLVFHEAMLIGEVVPVAFDFVRQNPAHPDVPSYQHIVVDEYQDLNRADQALIDALAGNASVTVVGDEDQSIYGFRFAHPEGIAQYPQTHAHTHDELLNECRRCPRTIVEMAGSLIGHNVRLEPRPLLVRPQNGNGEVYIVQHDSIEDEIANLAAYVELYLETHAGVAAGEVLVLANRRLIGNGIRDRINELARQNRRAWIAESFYFEDALKSDSGAEGFTVLCLLVNQDDRPGLRHWLGADANDCRRKPYARLRAHCEANGISPRQALEQMVAGNLRLSYTVPLVRRFTLLQQRLATLVGVNIPQLIDDLFPDGNNDVATVRQAALLIAPNVQTPRELVNELRVAITQPELPGTQGNAVRIMSLHKSKGLTARLVVIAGCVAGIIPTIDFDAPLDEQERQRQEQRRLFYVGITRSTETLVLSSAVRISRQVALNMNMRLPQGVGSVRLTASPFLAELGPQAPQPMRANVWRAQVGF
jgi:DNA helicase II / ATP-dependent DNA helicase PcrA